MTVDFIGGIGQIKPMNKLTLLASLIGIFAQAPMPPTIEHTIEIPHKKVFKLTTSEPKLRPLLFNYTNQTQLVYLVTKVTIVTAGDVEYHFIDAGALEHLKELFPNGVSVVTNVPIYAPVP